MSQTVLIVDDSRATRKILSGIMEDVGFAVTPAEDGADGLRILGAAGACDLALVDWNMPNMNGLEFVKAVRQNPDYQDMKIMMVTTESEMENVMQALSVGANEYVMKPFTRETIQEKLLLLGLSA